ncbi:hypothetical protein N7533_008721 [Penicillium manginii]|uniref:uncharacterized protein n=1 Tax=Penicillium manginii TaxID=203109 RepID=UPI002548FA78|nr:uncharacterized protein N7533_008721 [Penicillium manginii]KAJ5743851.1 hypothetical protein N7533_008721 [Penicillium manginii]
MPLLRRDSSNDYGPQLLRDVWALTAVAILMVILRIIAKLRIGKFGTDDLLMTFALVSPNLLLAIEIRCLALIGSILLTLAIQYGFGRPASENDSEVSKIIMYDYLSQTFSLAGGTLGRVSFIVFIVGLLVQRLSERIVLWALAALQVIVNGMVIIIIFVQCPGHASAIWDHSGKSKCWDLRVQEYYGYFQGAFNATTDLYLAVFSTYIFWYLNLKLRVKLGLVALLGMGIFAMVAAIIKTVQTHVLGTSDSDPTIATVNYDRWLYIETYLVIITASVPCVRSLFRSSNSRKISTGNTHELNSRHATNSSHNTRPRRRDSSIDGKRIIDLSEDYASNDDVSNNHYEAPESRQSRESVAMCV